MRKDTKDLPHNQLKEEENPEKHPQKQAEDWEMELSKLEETIERKENEAQGLKRKIGMMDHAWKLLELGKETIESEGVKWKISPERRDHEAEVGNRSAGNQPKIIEILGKTTANNAETSLWIIKNKERKK